MQNNKISIFFLLISITVFSYVFFRSEIHWSGEMRSYYINYYIISIILIFSSLLSFFLNKNIKIYLTIFLISISASLYLFETYVTFFSEKHFFNFYENSDQNLDKRSKIQVYKDLSSIDENPFINMAPSMFLKDRNIELFPLSGKSFSKTVLCNELGYYSILDTDRYGFNNPDEEWNNIQIDYVIIGDSFAHGACVNKPNDVSSIMRKLNKKKILNLGFSGSGPLIQHAILKEYLKEKKVKKIFWLYYEGNDQQDLHSELKNHILKNYILDKNFNQNLINKQPLIDKLNQEKLENSTLSLENKKKYLPKFLNFIKLRNTRNIFFSQTISIHNDFYNIVKQNSNFAKKKNAELFFVYLPEYTRYKKKYDDSNYNKIKKLLIDLDIPIIDLHEKIFSVEENKINLFAYDANSHYSIEGYKRVAKEIMLSSQ